MDFHVRRWSVEWICFLAGHNKVEPKVAYPNRVLSILRCLVSQIERKPECYEDVQGRAIKNKCQGENAAPVAWVFHSKTIIYLSKYSS